MATFWQASQLTDTDAAMAEHGSPPMDTPAIQTGTSDVSLSRDLNDAIDAASNDSVWVRKWDDATNSLYYFNIRTQESSWEEPKEYKAVLMSEPLDTGEKNPPKDQSSLGDQHDDQEGPIQESSASLAIQSLYRGRVARKRVKEARQWTEQFDPGTGQKYYYNSVTGESQWEKPADVLVGIKDERSTRAVKIQTIFRAKKARDRVKQLEEEEEAEEQQKLLEQQQREQEQDEARARAEALAKQSSPEVQSSLQAETTWSEYFDPRSRKYYYRNVTTDAITWDKPDRHVSSWVKGSQRDTAALSIQCTFRKRIATNNAGAKREKLRALTDPDVMEQKLGELKQVSVEIQEEIEARTLVSVEEEQFPHLVNLLAGWHQSFESIKNNIHALEFRGEDIQHAESVTGRVDLAERFHKSLAEVRSECLALLRSILLMNSYFVDLDVARINVALATFTKWKAHGLCVLKDSRVLEIVQGSDISQLLDHAETKLRQSMGLADFNNGTTSAAGKRYEDWHPFVEEALTAVRGMEQRLSQMTDLVRGYRTDEARKREISQMRMEELLVTRIAQQQQRRLNDEANHTVFVKKCQEWWQKGVNQRNDEIRAAAAHEQAEIQKRIKHQEMIQNERIDQASKSKLSIWEAVKEGLPVEVVRTMVFAEMQKARRLGYDFLVKSARSDHGETLIQIACWWGHVNLVKFFLDEGADHDSVDSSCNRFSLLHDAARRGHALVIRILLEHGLACDVTDSTGDTPFHWAARKNHFSAVLTLLGVYTPDRDQAMANDIIKAVRQKNHRGKTPFAIAKGDRVRHFLKLAEEGCLPPLRRARTAERKPVPGFSRRMTEVGNRDRSRGSVSAIKSKTSKMLKMTKHSSKVDLSET